MKSKLINIFLLAIAVFSFYRVYSIYETRHRDLSGIVVQVEKGVFTPVRFVIKDLGIDLPIFESEIFEGEWEDTKEGISYLKTSPLPGDVGNTIMYGHNWENVLKNLRHISKDSKIEITFSDGQVRTFVFNDKFDVTTDQIHILDQSNYPKLTIYTCDNFLDSKRLVVTALPKNDFSQ